MNPDISVCGFCYFYIIFYPCLCLQSFTNTGDTGYSEKLQVWDVYQVMKVAGGDPPPKAQLVAAETAGTNVDASCKRKKNKAKRARSTQDVEAEVEEETVIPETGDVPVEDTVASRGRGLLGMR